jgi:hypothetical protein
VAVDVLDRLLERVDDADRQLQVEVLGVPVLLARRADLDAAGARRGALVADQLDPGVAQVGERTGQELAATAASTSSVSAALQTPGRWTLALTAIRRAISRSASAWT